MAEKLLGDPQTTVQIHARKRSNFQVEISATPHTIPARLPEEIQTDQPLRLGRTLTRSNELQSRDESQTKALDIMSPFMILLTSGMPLGFYLLVVDLCPDEFRACPPANTLNRCRRQAIE